MLYFRDKTQVHMFYYDSNNLERVCWQDVVWLTVHWDPNNNYGSMNVFRYFNDAQFNFYKNDFAMLKFY